MTGVYGACAHVPFVVVIAVCRRCCWRGGQQRVLRMLPVKLPTVRMHARCVRRLIINTQVVVDVIYVLLIVKTN
jgi:hypothetical protein